MGTQISNISKICCYKNINNKNLDNDNRVTFLNTTKKPFEKVQSINSNFNTNILNSNINALNSKSKEKSPKEEKITAYSTAAISKTVSNINLKQVNLIKIPKTYFDKEMIITKEAIDENICKIQRLFHINLIKKNKKISEREESFLKNENFIRAHSGIPNEITETIESDMKVSEEPNFNQSSCRHNSKKNITISSFHQKSSSSFYSKIDYNDLSTEPKGYFLYKKKNYDYIGNRDSKGKKKGFGMIIWRDGSIIKSNFKNSKINGYGIFKDSQINNGIFYGFYKDNIPNGYGYYIKENLKLEGDNWEKNNLNGIGMEIWNDDNFYQGEMYKCEKNGIGLYRWPDGTLCLGEWKENKLNGYGIMKYSDDSIYVGQFKNNLMDGYGEFLWGDAEYYCGYYNKGIKEGFGIYVWNFDKLCCYVGFWENGRQNGVGIKIIEGVEKYGVFKDGRKTNSLNGSWEIEDYLRSEQVKYKKFLTQNIKSLIKYIVGLKKGDILVENSFTLK